MTHYDVTVLFGLFCGLWSNIKYKSFSKYQSSNKYLKKKLIFKFLTPKVTTFTSKKWTRFSNNNIKEAN